VLGLADVAHERVEVRHENKHATRCLCYRPVELLVCHRLPHIVINLLLT
jgi:hypothetical protein